MTKYEDLCVQIKKLNVFLSFHASILWGIFNLWVIKCEPWSIPSDTASHSWVRREISMEIWEQTEQDKVTSDMKVMHQNSSNRWFATIKFSCTSDYKKKLNIEYSV